MTKKIKSIPEGWEVEWCIERGYTKFEDGTGEANPDKDVNTFRDFATKEAAVRYAKRVLPEDQYGSIRVTHFHSEFYEPNCPATFREYDGQPEVIES